MEYLEAMKILKTLKDKRDDVQIQIGKLETTLSSIDVDIAEIQKRFEEDNEKGRWDNHY